jgi:hypothetical protein
VVAVVGKQRPLLNWALRGKQAFCARHPMVVANRHSFPPSLLLFVSRRKRTGRDHSNDACLLLCVSPIAATTVPRPPSAAPSLALPRRTAARRHPEERTLLGPFSNTKRLSEPSLLCLSIHFVRERYYYLFQSPDILSQVEGNAIKSLPRCTPVSRNADRDI